MRTPMIVAVRGYAIPIKNEDPSAARPPGGGRRKGLPSPSTEALIFDCETTSDHAQSLRFGTYQCRKRGRLVETGIFYETDNPKALSRRDLGVIRAYAKAHALTLRTREEFVREVFYKYAYWYGAVVVGFNLPFDISRLAIGISTSHAHDMRNAFSFTLVQDKNVPNVLVKHLNAKASFIRFASVAFHSRSALKRGEKPPFRCGYFQDVKTLAAALLGKSYTLKSLADALETNQRKMDAEKHGAAISTAYLDYALADTQTTWECYVKLAALYAQHGLTGTPAHRIYSEASLGKAYLNQMGIVPPRKMQPDVPAELLGHIMGSYYGGRAEVRIRRRVTRVLYCDFRSMYPTVCTLMGLWQFVIAKGFDWQDWTAEARSLLKDVHLGHVGKKKFWKLLTVLVEIAPSNDVLPVRAAYSGKSRTIGLNYLKSDIPMWFTLADCIASKLLTGRTPRIIRAIKFTARGPQDGLTPIKLGGDENLIIDPVKGDFYRDLILERGKVQAQQKKATSANDIERLKAQSMTLKLMANSTSYGIYAEQNVQSSDRPHAIELFGQEGAFHTTSKSVEEPGTHFHPLIATLITGAARLMLATAERLASENRLNWAFCDTDSLALARLDEMPGRDFLARCAKVTGWFDKLDPYGDGKPLFKVEDQNFCLQGGKVTGQHRPLYALAISAKRYVLFNVDGKRRPVIRKALAHGLGHLMEPYGEGEAPQSIPGPAQSLATMEIKRWQYDLRYRIVEAFLAGRPERIDYSGISNLNTPARSRYGANTATLRNWFGRFNEGKPLHQQVKSFNFLIAFQVSNPAYAEALAKGWLDDHFADGLPAVVAPYSDNPKVAARSCFDRHTGKSVPVSILKTYWEAVADYAWHAESKFENGEEDDSGPTRRRHIEAVAVEYIGKEANRWEEQFYLGELPEAQIEYGISNEGRKRIIAVLSDAARKFTLVALAARAGITRQELAAIIQGHATPRMRTLRSLMRAMQECALGSSSAN